jgi:ATP-dependent Clp protease ATP-binding subunit ClpA
MQLTPRAKRLIDLAYEEAQQLSNNYIGTEHLLIAVIREGDGLGARVLRSLGADLERTREIVRSLQEASPQCAAGSTASPSATVDPEVAWQRFTERARRTVSLAQEEAVRMGENYVGTEQLLLGLVRLDDSVAARVLDRLGVPLGRIRADIERQVTYGPGNLGPDVPLTPRVQVVIALASEEAQRLNNNSIGTEHLLLGLIREGDCLAARVLLALGINLERTRPVIDSLQEAGPPPAPSTASSSSAAGSPMTGAVQPTPAAPSAEPAPEAAPTTGQTPMPSVVPPIPPWLRPSTAPPSQPATPWAKFNERARRALWLAQNEALAFGENFIGTEHLLLGITREREEIAVQMLARLGITEERIRECIVEQTTRGQRNPEQPLDATPRLRRAIDLAYDEARSLQQNFIGAEHLLLGLIREGDGLAAKVLMELGADLERARTVLQAGGFQAAPPTGESIIWEAPFWLPPQAAPSAGIPWTKLTERARWVLFLAHEEAMRLGYNRVNPNTLLLGLAREDNLATRILERLGISTARLRGEIEKGSPPGPGWSERCDLAPDVLAIIECAWEEAQALSHNYLGAEHLLLGFLRQEGRQTSAILVRLGVSLERVREEIPLVGARWAAIVEARRRLEEAEAAYRALLVSS